MGREMTDDLKILALEYENEVLRDALTFIANYWPPKDGINYEGEFHYVKDRAKEALSFLEKRTKK